MTQTHTTQPNSAHIDLSRFKPTPYSQLPAEDQKRRAETLMKERDAAARKEMERNLRLMLDYVGLEDEPSSCLGGNHPYAGPMTEADPTTGQGARPAATEPPPKVRHKLPLAVLRKIEEAERRAAEEKGKSKGTGKGAMPKAGSMPKKGRRRADPHRRPALPAELSAEALGLPECENPNPIELARRIEIYRYRNDLNITELAQVIGRSRSYVRNHLHLLDLPEAIKDHVEAGRLTEGHARIIGKMRDPEPMANLTIRRDLSVRQVELMARRLRYIGPYGELLRETAIPNRKVVEDTLEDIMGLKVRVHDRAGRGKFEIHYNSPEEAQSIVDGLGRVFVGLSEDDLERDY